MAWLVAGSAGVVALGVVVAVAFGPNALWVYGFFALIAGGTAVGAGVGGNIIRSWSSRRFENDRPARR
jgi:hypothetical protein